MQFRQKADNIYVVRPRHWGHRLNYFPPLEKAQSAALAEQLASLAGKLGLRDPIFFHCNTGRLRHLCTEMKKRFFSVYLRLDYYDSDSDYFAQVSDATLAIPRSIFHKLKAKFGAKVKLMPQAVELGLFEVSSHDAGPARAKLAEIPRPRLGYLGPARDRLNTPLLLALLREHPQWHMVSIGDPAVPLPNAHALPKVDPEGLAGYVREFDVGFLPYDCGNEQWLHCVPLKLFEYFALGLPVVSAPLINLGEYEDLIYFGDTPESMAPAIKAALDEPADSPKRSKRMQVAREHSIESLGRVLRDALRLPVHAPSFGEESCEEGESCSLEQPRLVASSLAAPWRSQPRRAGPGSTTC